MRTLSEELHAEGHPAGATAVAELLRGLGYSLQANVKTAEGKQHPDRDAQFCTRRRTAADPTHD